MSGLAGILSVDGARSERPAMLAAMSKALAACGPDDCCHAGHRGAAMVCRAFHVSSESRLTKQPVLSGDGLLLAWDGRLDNRPDLERRLGIDSDPKRPDVELVLAAYRRWRQDFVDTLIGDFALALWDAAERRLYLARDPFAGRPLFFAVLPKVLVWATTIRALFASGVVRPEVDDAWVEAYIVNAEPADRSPFATVEVVPPGSVVIVSPAGRSRRRFWRPSGGEVIRYRRDEDYEEAFRELFFDAVRCRLRVDGPVCAELSGGLDSSSIVCAADRLIERGEVEATELYTQSWVYDRAAGSDERPFIEVVERHVGRPALHLLEDDFPMLAGFERVRPQIPNGYQVWPAGRARAVEMLRDRGCRVLLSGFAGDQLLWSQLDAPAHLADHLLHLRPLRLIGDLRRWHQAAGHPYPTLLWHGVMRALWRAVRRSGTQEPKFGFAWLSERVRSRRAHYTARSLGRGKDWLSPSRRMRLEAVRWMINARSWMYTDVEEGFETRYPFLDRRLVEFCLAIPFEQLARPHELRSLHRRALRGVLPESIRTRRCKRGPSEAILRGFRRQWPVIEALFADREARVYERGYVHRRHYLEELQRIRHGLYSDHAIVDRILQIEVWLRSIEHPQAPDGAG